MTYTKKFNPAKFTHLTETFQSLLDLSPGDKITLGGLEIGALFRTRWLVYDWLHHMGMREQFRISQREGELVIIRKGGTPPIIKKETSSLAELEPFLEDMLRADDPISWLRETRKEKKITAEEMGILLDRYNEVMI